MPKIRLEDYLPELPYIQWADDAAIKPTRFLCNGATAQYNRGSSFIADNTSETLAHALAYCTDGAGDYIFVLPGHSEAVTATTLSSCPAGVKLIGVGNVKAANAPKFSWNAAASTMAVASANITLANLALTCANAAAAVTDGFTITAAGFQLLNCDVVLSADNTAKFTNFIDFGAGGDGCIIAGNDMIGSTAGLMLAINVDSAVSGLRIIDNVIDCAAATAASSGVVTLAAATTLAVIARNFIRARGTATEVALAIADAAHSVVISDNRLAITKAATATAINVAAVTQLPYLSFVENYAVDTDGGAGVVISGVLNPAAT